MNPKAATNKQPPLIRKCTLIAFVHWAIIIKQFQIHAALQNMEKVSTHSFAMTYPCQLPPAHRD